LRMREVELIWRAVDAHGVAVREEADRRRPRLAAVARLRVVDLLVDARAVGMAQRVVDAERAVALVEDASDVMDVDAERIAGMRQEVDVAGACDQVLRDEVGRLDARRRAVVVGPLADAARDVVLRVDRAADDAERAGRLAEGAEP